MTLHGELTGATKQQSYPGIIHDPNTAIPAAACLAGHTLSKDVDSHFIGQFALVQPFCVITGVARTQNAELVRGEIEQGVHDRAAGRRLGVTRGESV